MASLERCVGCITAGVHPSTRLKQHEHLPPFPSHLAYPPRHVPSSTPPSSPAPPTYTHTQADVAGLERCVERIKSGVRDIDARVSKVSQTATRIGDRLQVRLTRDAFAPRFDLPPTPSSPPFSPALCLMPA